MQLKKSQVMNKQLANPQLTRAELLCRREGAEESLPGRMEAQSLGLLAGCQEAGAKPRCNVSLLSSLVRSAATFTAFQVFLNHLQKQD